MPSLSSAGIIPEKIEGSCERKSTLKLNGMEAGTDSGGPKSLL